MVAQKRKYSKKEEDEDSFDDSNEFEEVEQDDSDDDVDLSNILSNKRPRRASVNDEDEEDEEDSDDLQEFLQESMAKRDKKSGTETVKKLRGGKGKLVKGEVGGGSFQSMGLHPSLLRSLTVQGFRLPTPIQRLSIPILLSTPPRDLVAMARTGSGKTLAYMVPMVQRLGGRHATTFGARALILTPTRELGLQQLKVGKSLVKGWTSSGSHAGDRDTEDAADTQTLRWGLVVGGEGMDEQFEMIASNPDVIIATPGRLLHLIVEMNLDLSSVEYVVFDEADRLFEMGFETALTEIIHRLPSSRQTLLFSATLPKSLVEFAKAGLQEPQLVRLDVESKISSDLKMAFFSVHQEEKEACLLTLLRDVIKVPFGTSQSQSQLSEEKGKKKGKDKRPSLYSAPNQTLIFVATKHHVEFISNLLSTAGYAVSHIYGSLDQAARTHQMDQFRKGITNILVVTDVAARGIDIPILEHVINYDFPHGSRVFVHRVGRTARAGRQGWAWSFVTNPELPYLLDLQLFLGRPLKQEAPNDQAYIESLVIGTLERTTLDEEVEYIRSLEDTNHSLVSLRDVMKRGHAMYERSKGKASAPSYKRAKEILKDPKWLLAGSGSGIHPILLRGKDKTKDRAEEEARQALMRSVNSFTPSETVFELGTKGNSANAALMNQRRKALLKAKPRTQQTVIEEDAEEPKVASGSKLPLADVEDISAAFGANSVRDPEFYMSYYEKGASTEKGYSLTDGATFAQQAQQATFDLTGDDGAAERQKRGLRWDKKKKKFVKGDGVGADNVKLVKTESGVKLPASYRSGRFDEWKAKRRMQMPRVGEMEGQSSNWRPENKKFRHNNVTAPKALDKLHKNYDRKVRQMKKKESGGETEGDVKKGGKPGKPVKSGSRYGGKSIGRVKSELKTTEQIRKDRKLMEKKRAKNARPSRKSKGRR